FISIRQTNTFTLFPYTTLFRSSFKLENIKYIIKTQNDMPIILITMFNNSFPENIKYSKKIKSKKKLKHKKMSQSLFLKIEVFLGDRKSTRLNSSHVKITYAVYC